MNKKEIKHILSLFPVRKVRKVKQFCEDIYGTNGEFLLEQVYRGHYSSLKIIHSWESAKKAITGILFLCGYINSLEKINDEEVWNLLPKIFDDEHIVELYNYMKKEKFFGKISLLTAVYAIGANIVFGQYLKSVIKVLERLHTDKKYQKELQKRNVLNWEEAMLFKTFQYLKKKEK